MTIKVTSRKAVVHTITGVEGLDAVHFCMEDFGIGQGSITIDCFGQAWAMYWPAMGNYTIAEFLVKASTDYIARKLTDEPEEIIDFEKVGKAIGVEDICQETAWVYCEQLEKEYGDEWYLDELPKMPNHEYQYVCKIVDAVKIGIKELT